MAEVNGNVYYSNSGTIYDQSGMTQGFDSAAKKPETFMEKIKSWFDNGTHGKTAGGLMGAGGGSFVGAIIGSIVPGVGTVLGAVIGGMIGGSVGANVGGAAGEKNELNAMNAQYQELCNKEMAAFYGNNANGQAAESVGAGTRSAMDYSGLYGQQGSAATGLMPNMNMATAVGMGGAGYDANMYGQLANIYKAMGVPDSVAQFYIGSAPSANGFSAVSYNALATGAGAGAYAGAAGAYAGYGAAAPSSGNVNDPNQLLANFDNLGVGVRAKQIEGTDFADKQHYVNTDDNAHNVSLDGKDGDDDQFVSFGDGNDYAVMSGGAGADTQIAELRNGYNVLAQDGGSGNDYQRAEGGDGVDNFSQSGGTGNDEIHANTGDGNDVVSQDGGSGDDILRAAGGNGSDHITQSGGKGNDDIEANTNNNFDEFGNNYLLQDGGEGDDRMLANVRGHGSQTAKQLGGEGNDKMTIEYNGAGWFMKNDEAGDELNNIQYGGSGNDDMNIDMSKAWSQTSNKQQADSGDNKMNIEGGYGEDVNIQISGDGNDEQINYGNAGADTLKNFGGGGNDTIVQNGGADNDDLFADGGDGDDVIKMIGGDGSDKFEYNVSAGNDKVLIAGYGENTPGFLDHNTDTAVINFKKGDNFTIQNANGDVIYQQGRGGSVITVQDVENLQLVNSETKEKFNLLENGQKNSGWESTADYQKTMETIGFMNRNSSSHSSFSNLASIALNNDSDKHIGNGELDPLALFNHRL